LVDVPIGKIRESIDLPREYRRALITFALTGTIGVEGDTGGEITDAK